MLEFLGRLYNNEYYMLQVLTAEAIFAFALPRRKNFSLRLVVGLLFCFVAGFFVLDNIYAIVSLFWSTTFGYTAVFLTLYAVTVVCISFCFSASGWNVLFCSVGALATQNMANSIEQIVLTLTAAQAQWLRIIIMLATYGVVYSAMSVIFARRLYHGDCINVENKMVIMLSLLVAAVCFIFNSYAMSGDLTVTLKVVFRITLAVCCFITLCYQFSLLSRGRLQMERETMERIFDEKKKQYEVSKENIELINVKCHDLKYYIGTVLSERSSVDDEVLKEIEKAITIYDSVVKTGNDILDVILTEKSLLCDKEDIKMEIIADGGSLSFMNGADIYSLFGNAIENAIEAVKKLEDCQMRVIGLKVASHDNLLSIHVQNYYKSELIMEDGLPRTTKDDDANHGFGLKSIRLIANKYGGSVSVVAENHIFYLNILIPIP